MYMKNLFWPNIADVYYKHQLSFYGFNVHRLSDVDSAFHVNNEVVAKQGSNQVVSFLEKYIMVVLDQQV